MPHSPRNLRITESFRKALALVEEGQNLFVTGRAGTGKSTLLELVVDRQRNANRGVAVVAPTGVAALNVSGQTIHSFFAFRQGLSTELREYRPPSHLEDLELLIIDEISMARADLIDMMDVALRRVSGVGAPFGGIQVLMVGDLYQLPPVVNHGDGQTVMKDYSTPFFFSSSAIFELGFQVLELEEVFRQKDQTFISLLNRVRDGSAVQEDIDFLNTRLVDDESDYTLEGYITLTTTNKLADEVNRRQLALLESEIFLSHATFGGDFDAHKYKVDVQLEFSVGAQVMMLVNTDDYVNGSMGVIVDVDGSTENLRVLVRLNGSDDLVWVARYRWSILRPERDATGYSYREVGFFEQLPFKLAWAVTVHKSQGKTFDKVIFDKGRAVFAEGQLYVALSRCRSLEGLRLAKPLRLTDVKTAPEVAAFDKQRRLEPALLVEEPLTFVGFVETGGGRFSRLVEFSLIRCSGEKCVQFSSLVNPGRDMALARESGLTAATVLAAPALADVRALVLQLVNGSVLVGENVNKFMVLLGLEPGGESGFGIDLVPILGGSRISLDESAEARSLSARDSFQPFMAQKHVFSPVKNQNYPLEPGAYFLGRDRVRNSAVKEIVDAIPLEGEELAIWHAASLDIALVNSDSVNIRFDRLTQDFAKDVVSSLVSNLEERSGLRHSYQLIEEYCRTWKIPKPAAPSDDLREVVLSAGMRVCLTGEPPSGADYALLNKASLRRLIEIAGMIEVNSVTKKNCDLLVAFNAASMSGKAKKARELGKPIIDAAMFSKLLEGS